MSLAVTTEIPQGTMALAAAVRRRDHDDAIFIAGLADYDGSKEWDALWSSPNAFLKDLGMHRRDAFVAVKLARKLHRLPTVLTAWLAGTVNGGQVRTIGELVVDRHEDLFNAMADEMLSALTGLTGEETETAMRLWRDRADAIDDGPEPGDDAPGAFLHRTSHNRGALNATLDADTFAAAEVALRSADPGDDETLTGPQRRLAALRRIFEFFNDHQNDKAPRRHKPHVLVVLQGETLGTDYLTGFVPATGMSLPPETLERLLCDCVMHRVVMADGVVLDHGRAVKTPPPDVFEAVVARDHHCRWKNCVVPATDCHAHHVKWFGRDRGETSIFNLVLLCAKHHSMLHRTGWHAVLRRNGDLDVTQPNGTTWTTRPPGALQTIIPMPGPDPDEEDGSFAAHRAEIEGNYRVRLRVEALKAGRPERRWQDLLPV